MGYDVIKVDEPSEEVAEQSTETGVEVAEVEVADMDEESIGAMFEDGQDEAGGELGQGEAQDTEQAAAEPDAQEGEQEAAGQEGEQAQPVSQFQPPAYLNDDERQGFDALPEEAKEAFLRLEGNREAFIQRKSQELSQEKRFVEALRPLGQRLQEDPAFLDYLKAYGKQPEVEQQPDLNPADMDPLEYIKQEAKREVMAEVQPLLQQTQQQVQQGEVQREIQAAQAHLAQDELYQDVASEISRQVNQLPGYVHMVQLPDGSTVADPSQSYGMRAQTYFQLDQDPRAYSDYYAQVRQGIAATRQPAQPANPAPEQQEQPKTPVAERRVTPRAPFLEKAGAEQQNAAEATRRNQRKATWDRINATQTPEAEDIGALFDLL